MTAPINIEDFPKAEDQPGWAELPQPEPGACSRRGLANSCKRSPPAFSRANRSLATRGHRSRIRGRPGTTRIPHPLIDTGVNGVGDAIRGKRSRRGNPTGRADIRHVAALRRLPPGGTSPYFLRVPF